GVEERRAPWPRQHEREYHDGCCERERGERMGRAGEAATTVVHDATARAAQGYRPTIRRGSAARMSATRRNTIALSTRSVPMLASTTDWGSESPSVRRSVVTAVTPPAVTPPNAKYEMTDDAAPATRPTQAPRAT